MDETEKKVDFIIKHQKDLWGVLQKDDALSSMLVDMIKREQESGSNCVIL